VLVTTNLALFRRCSGEVSPETARAVSVDHLVGGERGFGGISGPSALAAPYSARVGSTMKLVKPPLRLLMAAIASFT